MTQSASNQQKETSRPMSQLAMSLIEISRFWLGIDNTSQPVRMGELHVEAIVQALLQGKHIHCRDWTIQPTPPRSIPGKDGNREWVPGLIASSIHGFTSALRIDRKNVEFICQYIQQRDRVVSQRNSVADPYDSAMEEAEEIEA